MDDAVIYKTDHTLTHPMVDPRSPSGFTVRTEALKKFTVQIVVTNRYLEMGAVDQSAIEIELNKQLRRELKKAGRVQHGAARMSQHENHLEDTVVFRIVAVTRESQEGQWPAIHEALRQDEEDRLEALRNGGYDLED
jgi:cell division FtsZ-interacting protein ZapD